MSNIQTLVNAMAIACRVASTGRYAIVQFTDTRAVIRLDSIADTQLLRTTVYIEKRSIAEVLN